MPGRGFLFKGGLCDGAGTTPEPERPCLLDGDVMPSVGPNSSGTITSDAAYGTFAWSNPSNAATSNNTRTVASAGDIGTTRYLKCLNFGFTIPVGAVITGIGVSIERSADNASVVSDNRVRLVKSGAVQTTDKASATLWLLSDVVATYGGEGDVWSGSWTAEDINAADFGVVISVGSTLEGGGNVSIDHVTMTIHYTPGASSKGRVGGGSVCRKRVCSRV